MAARFMKSATIYIQIALAAHTHAQIENCIVCVYVYVRGCLIIKINEYVLYLKCNLPAWLCTSRKGSIKFLSDLFMLIVARLQRQMPQPALNKNN